LSKFTVAQLKERCILLGCTLFVGWKKVDYINFIIKTEYGYE
jgi:hypothetical protein